MEQTLNNVLQYKHIKEPTNEILRYINDRRIGVNKSLKTRWYKFNRQCMGGIEPNVIYTIAGISGSGKSSFVNSLETDLFDLNPKEDLIVLSFSFEMLSSRQIGRKLSYKMRRTTSELYTGTENSDDELNEDDINNIKKHAEVISEYPIYYVDSPGTVNDIENTIKHFQSTIAHKKWLLVILDHTLLTRGSSGDKERGILHELEKVFIETKKYGKTTIIQISQMNRDIENSERVGNKNMHYPMRKDIFGSDSVFQTSDYVIVLHRPELLGIREYGPGTRKYPSGLPVKDMVYMHFLKVREGEPKILTFVNNLKYNSIEEYKEN